MRFPWLQVDADFIAAHAGDLGAHLGISRREAIGLAVDLWTWALARAPDDAPPDGIVTGTGAVPDRLLSGSVGWTGPEAALTDALVACGLAVRIESGYRLTGFSRYKATWEKNRRRPGPKPDRNRTGTGGMPERKTQTQTQKEEETTLSAGADGEPEDLPDATEDAHPIAQALLLAVAPLPEKPKERPEDLQALWNSDAHPNLPRWKELTEARRRKATTRLRERPLSEWREVIRRINGSAFLRGEQGTWRASPDWLLQPDAAVKVLEGKYESTGAGSAPITPKPTKFVEM